MVTARQEQKVYKFERKGDKWILSGQENSFRVSVALLCPALGGSRLMVLMDRETGEYSLPGFWSEGLVGSTPEESALKSLVWIVPKDLSCRPLNYHDLTVNPEAVKFAETNGMNYKNAPIEMVPCGSFSGMADKVISKDSWSDNTLVSMSPDGKVEIIFVFDLTGGDVCGRMALSFASANSAYEVSRLTTRRISHGLKLTETPAEKLIIKLVEELEK